MWEYQWCYNGTIPGDCDYLWHPYTAGTNVTSISPCVYAQDYYVYTRVRQYAWQGGLQIGAGEWGISGPGTRTSHCGGGGGPLAVPQTEAGDTLKTHGTAAGVDPTAERRNGIGHAGNR